MSKRPHIVLFNPDQWRGDALGHLGNPAVVTPNLDRLVAEQAVSLSQTYCQNPVCTPSRCSFMTGWYPHVRGHRTMYHMLRPQHDETNLLKVLKDSGYFVWWGGKNDLVPGQDGYAQHADVKFQPTDEDWKRWQLTPRPGTHGWTDWRGEPGSDTYYSFFAGRLETGGERAYGDHDWANVLGACDFIRGAPQDRPLLIYIPLGYPHPPYGVEEPWYSMTDRGKLPPRVPAPGNWDDLPMIMKGLYDNFGMGGWTEDRWDELRATYYGMCARVDHQLGMVIEALREAGLYDETALFVFSDHGDFTGDYSIVEKTQNTFQDCLTRVPFVIKPPAGTPVKPRVSDALVELVDLSATVYDLADVEPGYDAFGRSLLPLLAGETDSHRDAVFCEGGRRLGEKQACEFESTSSLNPEGLYYPRISLQTTDERPWHGKGAMCRTRDYKYVRRLYEKDELYDLRNDPGEVRNLVDDPAYAPILGQLRDRMMTWYQETCDVVPRQTDQRW